LRIPPAASRGARARRPSRGAAAGARGESVRLAAVVCHPHPLYGGTLHNKVVHRAAATLHALGAAVLRFNFRGAGKSDGWFDGGAGELEDARAALEFLEARYPDARFWVGRSEEHTSELQSRGHLV